MIIFDQVTDFWKVGGSRKQIFSSATVHIPSNRRIALLGPSEEDRRLAIELLGGLRVPAKGRILRKARVSFPVGHLGGFVGDLPVRHNVEHVARLYGADVDTVTEFVERVAEIGMSFEKPYADLDKNVQTRLSQIVPLSIPFDVYVLNIGATWKRFDAKSRALFEARARTSGMIVAATDDRFVRAYCDMAMVLHRGRVLLFEDVEHALAFM